MVAKKNGDSRDAFKKFMVRRGLKPHPWATLAGVRSSALYNFINGDSHSLSGSTLLKLAKAANASIEEMVGESVAKSIEQGTGAAVKVPYTVGIYGRLFDSDSPESVARPIGASADLALLGARVDKDGLHPIPGGWLVFFEQKSRTPKELIGKLVVAQAAHSNQMAVRELRRGSTSGLYTLLAWNAAAQEDVEVDAAHLVVAIAQPLEVSVSNKK